MASKHEYRRRRAMPLRLLAKAEGYCMVRHKGCMVFVMNEREWNSLPLCDKNGADLEVRDGK